MRKRFRQFYCAVDWSLLGGYRRRLQTLFMILALLAAMTGPAAQAAPPESRVLPQLKEQAAAQPDQTFRVIVTRHKKDTRADKKVKEKGGKKLKDLTHDAFVAEMSGRDIAALGADPAVKFVAPDALMRKTGGRTKTPTTTSNVDRTKLATLYPGAVDADVLWTANGQTLSTTGKGVGVAVLDTGISQDKGDFSSPSGNSRVVASVSFNRNTNGTFDAHGHGTHVASIIGGNSWLARDTAVQGKYIGIAPLANIINVKVSDDAGMSYLSDVVMAIEWVIANRQSYNIRVMNLSMVSSVAESAKTSTLAAAVERAWFSGILVVVAAGNSGPDTMQYPPANDPFVVTVGASDMMGTDEPEDNAIAPWSSFGTTQDGYSKPDVVAPGRYMAGLMTSRNSTLAGAYPERIVDSYYIKMSGTSMAAPVVSGIAALAFQRHPEWTNDQVKWLLQTTANQLGPLDLLTQRVSPVPGQGTGEADARKVVDYTGVPQFANQGLTINEQLVTSDGSANYSSATWSTANWSTANWSTANWSTANWSTANWSTANWSTANWSAAAEEAVE